MDRFYTSQLYEYEPILQVQRAQSRGHSCSRELHAAILKRKKSHEDYAADNSHANLDQACSISSTYANAHSLLDNCNPLNRFDSTQMDMKSSIDGNDIVTNRQGKNKAIPASSTFTQFMGGTNRTGGWYNWDDYAME